MIGSSKAVAVCGLVAVAAAAAAAAPAALVKERKCRIISSERIGSGSCCSSSAKWHK